MTNIYIKSVLYFILWIYVFFTLPHHRGFSNTFHTLRTNTKESAQGGLF